MTVFAVLLVLVGFEVGFVAEAAGLAVTALGLLAAAATDFEAACLGLA